jgi:hypothetical protein
MMGVLWKIDGNLVKNILVTYIFLTFSKIYPKYNNQHKNINKL